MVTMQFELRDSGDLKAVSRALRQQADGKQLRRQLVKELGGIARPLASKVRAAWRAAPSHGHQSATRGRREQPDLRALLSKATRSQVRLTGKDAGVRIRTDGRKLSSGMRALPTYAEGTKRPWRHPIYGNRNAWASQRSFPRFYQAVKPDEAAARHAAERAVENIFKQIARAR
jgi:hypothetical protein